MSPGSGIAGPQIMPANPPSATTLSDAPPPGAWGGPLEHVPAAQIMTRPDRDQPATYHEVRSGETLSVVAAKYRVPVQRLIRANGLDGAGSLKPGQLIYIPRDPIPRDPN